MQRILRKTTWLIITFFISFTLVASNGIVHPKIVTNNALFNQCLTPDLLSCQNILPPVHIPFTPDPSLNDKQRFLSAINNNLPIVPPPGNFQYILLRAYGGVFVNQEPEIKLPQKVILANEEETKEFQSTLKMAKVNGTNDCYLQEAAAAAFNKAQASLGGSSLSRGNIPLKSGYGSGDCTRTFATNLRFWQKYANHRTLANVYQGKETAILGVVAPPGTSQHLWGLAVDLSGLSQKQKQALNQNGWFQTVENDIPHWTYIGLTPDKLPLFGLKKKVVGKIIYWITPL